MERAKTYGKESSCNIISSHLGIDRTLETVNNDITGEGEVIAESNDLSEIVNNNATEEKETASEMNNNSVEYIGNTLISNLTDFSEGRAFVQFKDYSEIDVEDAVEAYRAALIDVH